MKNANLRARPAWKNVYTLNSAREGVAGSAKALAAAIGRGADLRIRTAFRHNEHIDTTSPSRELVTEVAEFRATCLLDNRWAAGFMTLRQPISLPDGFGPRPSMSFFLYNQDGTQAIARPHLDGRPTSGAPGSSPLDDHSAMPRYHQLDAWDAATNAPSSNFVYDFESFHYYVRDDWNEQLSHTAGGEVISGSIGALARAFERGCEVKIAIRGLCADLVPADAPAIPHEVFIQAHSCYYYNDSQLLIAGTHPLVRVKPAIPLRYESHAWDFGWLMVRTDGHAARSLIDPYSLAFRNSTARYAMRWFTR